MSSLNRRDALKGAAATAAMIACETIAPASAAVIVPRQSCGCPRIHEIAYGHTCTLHDKSGKRYDSYTFEDVAAEYHATKEIQTADTGWCCYCGRHDDDYMPVGTNCLWNKTSYEYDEWECKCAEAVLDDWLHAVTTDWIAMAKEGGFA